MTLTKKIILFFSSTVAVILSVCLVFVYLQSRNLVLDQGKEKAVSMISTFEATMNNGSDQLDQKTYEAQLQDNLINLKQNLPELVEFNIYKISDNPKAIASTDENQLNKKADPEDITAAKQDKTVVLVSDQGDGNLEVDVTAPLHINGQVNYVAGVVFSLTDEVQLISNLLIKIVLFGVGSLILMIFIVWFFNIRKIVNKLRNLALVSNQISQGNLQVKIDVDSKDEIGDLEKNFNYMVQEIKGLVGQIKDMSYSVEKMSKDMHVSLSQSVEVSEQISTAVSDLSGRASQQSEAAQEGNQKVADVVSGLEKITEYTSDSQKLTTKTAELVEEGTKTVEKQKVKMEEIKQASEDVNDTISALAVQSKEISGIIEVVNNISEQINLLSLNAAIEAARAGEHGRGFSVVADEVRKLAEQSKESVTQISSLISGIQSYIGNAVVAMEKSGESVKEQEAAVTSTTERFNDIKSAVLTMTEQIREVYKAAQNLNQDAVTTGENISNIAGIIEESAAGTEEISASIEEQAATIQSIFAFTEKIVTYTEDLTRYVNRFNV